MASIFVLLVVGGLMHAARSFAPTAGLDGSTAGTAMALGYLLISAHLSGELFQRIHLPRLTGYLVTGIVVGPAALGLISDEMVISLRIFNGIAISLIALTAGCEMEFRALRSQIRAIGWITLIAVLGSTALLTLAAYWLRFLLPFMSGMRTEAAIATAVVLGVTMVAQSPAVAVALRDEMQADGPLSRTVLGVVVLSDILIVLLFAVASTLVHAVNGTRTEVWATALSLAREIFGSGLAGIVLGWLASLFLKRTGRGSAFFVLAVGFAVAEVGQRVQLDPLLIALALGLFIRNATSVGNNLLEAIEAGSLPVYVTFFAVAGATIRLKLLLVVGLPVAIFAAVRAAGFVGGVRLAARVAGLPEAVRKYAGFGLIPQSGLALALALLFAKTFPDFGSSASTLIFALVAINEIAGPVLYRMALVATGEAGANAIPEIDTSNSQTATIQ